MTAQRFRVQLGYTWTRRLFLSLSLINVLLTATTAAFIWLWGRMDVLPGGLQTFTRYVLVQGHLATENVVASWYSSILLLGVSLASLLAFAIDRRKSRGPLKLGWILFAAIFALLSLDELGSLHERVGLVRTAATSNVSVGWAYLLAVPIATVALFMVAFGWGHVRRVTTSFRLILTGTGLFLLNPVLEVIEMALIHGAGATPGTWQRGVHDLLLVLEEGGLELFGILCFLVAAIRYVQTTADEAMEWTIRSRTPRAVIYATTLVLLGGTFGAKWFVARLPAGDTGIPQHWFPAAALLLLALTAPRPLLTAALALSAFFGAGLHGYTTWQSYDALRVVLNVGLAVGFGAALWVSSRGARGAGLAAAALMAAGTNITGEYATLLAITAAGLAMVAVSESPAHPGTRVVMLVRGASDGQEARTGKAVLTS